jgi:hypothetical protein
MHSYQRALTTWTYLPGNWDVLHLTECFPADNHWGIPTIARQHIRPPACLLPWGSRPQLLSVPPASRTAIHFFLDDYRFESLWRNPARNLDALSQIGCVLSPDFSIWREMPVALQIFQVYRNRWLGCFWQARGLQVIPTVSWAQADDFCFAGIERGSVVAISSVGVVRDREAHKLFRAGLERMLEIIQPAMILSYGAVDRIGIEPTVPIVVFPTHWEQKRSAQRQGKPGNSRRSA